MAAADRQPGRTKGRRFRLTGYTLHAMIGRSLPGTQSPGCASVEYFRPLGRKIAKCGWGRKGEEKCA